MTSTEYSIIYADSHRALHPHRHPQTAAFPAKAYLPPDPPQHTTGHLEQAERREGWRKQAKRGSRGVQQMSKKLAE